MDDTGRLLLGKLVTLEEDTDQNGNPTRARVVPIMAEDAITTPLVIPWHLRGGMGELEPDTEVVYTVFANQSGMILARADGEWSGQLEGDVELAGDLALEGDFAITGDVETEGTIKAEDFETKSITSYNTHVHIDVVAGDEESGEPKKE